MEGSGPIKTRKLFFIIRVYCSSLLSLVRPLAFAPAQPFTPPLALAVAPALPPAVALTLALSFALTPSLALCRCSCFCTCCYSRKIHSGGFAVPRFALRLLPANLRTPRTVPMPRCEDRVWAQAHAGQSCCGAQGSEAACARRIRG